MFPFLNFHNNYLPCNNKFVRILRGTTSILDFVTKKLYLHSRKSFVSNGKNPKRKPAVLNVDSVTIFWIVAAFLFIPLILTGLLSQ